MAYVPARYNTPQQLDVIVVNGNINNIPAAGVAVGAIPRGSIILHTSVVVDTAVNAGTSSSFTMGTTPTGTDIATAANTAVATAGYKTFDTAKTLNPTVDTQIYASFTYTGTAPTAGAWRAVITFAPNNDFAGVYGV